MQTRSAIASMVFAKTLKFRKAFDASGGAPNSATAAQQPKAEPAPAPEDKATPGDGHDASKAAAAEGKKAEAAPAPAPAQKPSDDPHSVGNLVNLVGARRAQKAE